MEFNTVSQANTAEGAPRVPDHAPGEFVARNQSGAVVDRTTRRELVKTHGEGFTLASPDIGDVVGDAAYGSQTIVPLFFLIMGNVDPRGRVGLTIQEMAVKVSRTQATIKRAIDTLEKAGVVLWMREADDSLVLCLSHDYVIQL